MPFGSGQASLFRQSRFWILQLAGWLLINALYFRESIDLGLHAERVPLTGAITATSWGAAVACSSVLAAVYLWMPPRRLTGFRAIPMVFGLSLVAALLWAAVMTLLVAGVTSTEWRQYGPWMFFHASVLMAVWSGAFLWFMRSDRVAKTESRVLGAEALAPKVVASNPVQADCALGQTRRAIPSSGADRVTNPRWTFDHQVCLEEANRVHFCLVRDIVCIRAAGDYAQVHLTNGEIANVRQRLRYWESQLPESFVRIHRSALVNLELTEELEHVDGAWRVRLRGREEPLAVSRRLEKRVRAKFIAKKGGLQV